MKEILKIKKSTNSILGGSFNANLTYQNLSRSPLNMMDVGKQSSVGIRAIRRTHSRTGIKLSGDVKWIGGGEKPLGECVVKVLELGRGLCKNKSSIIGMRICRRIP